MRQTLTAKGISWHILTEPNTEELVEFVRETDLLPVDAEFVADAQGRPEITWREDYLLLLILVPVFDKELRVTSGEPWYVVVKENTIYSISYQPIVALQKLIQDFEEHPDKQAEYFGEDAMSLLLHVIGQLNDSSFRKISRLAKHIEIAEDAVFQGNERKMVEEIAILSRDVLDFRKIVRPHLQLFKAMPQQTLSDEIRTQWLRVSGQFMQLWEILESLHESSKELRNTNDSLLQHKENELLRLLTYYSIIAIPVWIFVAPFDPFSEGATTVDAIIFYGILGLLTVLLLYIFMRSRRRRVL